MSVVRKTPPPDGEAAPNIVPGWEEPPAVGFWVGECRCVLNRALCGRAQQETSIRAGMAVRTGGNPPSEAQEAEIDRRLSRGDKVRQIARDWYDQHLAECNRTKRTPRSYSEHVCQPLRLAYLATLGLVPQPPPAVRAWLDSRTVGRRPIDADLRQDEATELVASGGWGPT